MTVCVDASLVIKLLTPEPGSGEVQEWFVRHAEDELVAPHFLVAEVLSSLRRKCKSGEITSQEARAATSVLESLGLKLVWEWGLAERALALSEELEQATVYDSIYLAVAEATGCEFWTMDARFARSVAPRYPFVRLLELSAAG
ncbi:MAG: type II toxin-antitoxin system VapC family toxin [Betaproteobacteria bacterium]